MAWYRAEVDVAGFGAHEVEFPAYAWKFGVLVRLIKESGPAGGNPLYEVTGAEQAMRAFASDFCRNADPIEIAPVI